ncbi:hypothetical protein [Devosia alba]|uniref:hypothetical protein n=1 Tax=Devosia alba TaxID=3152360 RepID=UPI0032646B0D
MAGAVGYVDGELVITKDGRTVLTTMGKLIQFLTTEQTFTTSAVYPDVPKGEGYVWEYHVVKEPGGYSVAVDNSSSVLARPQEWTNQLVLGAVPAGADIFIGRISLNRTVAPTHSWSSEALVPRVPMNQAMQITGSILLEQVRGLGRVMSVFISDGNLVLDLQQSCGPVSGNFVTWGQPLAFEQSSLGGVNSAPSGPGKYVALADIGYSGSGGVAKFSSTNPFEETVLSIVSRYQKGGSTQAVYSDPTNYGTTYAVTVKGRFGRRS